MARSKSDISNHTIRIFLQMVGKFYDEKRGYKPFTKTNKNIEQLLNSFNNRCCFCNKSINEKTISLDHLIPTNKENLGLNAWGNIVPACASCNDKKHNNNWIDYINSIVKLSPKEKEINIKQLKNYLKSMKYNPNLELKEIAENLYDDVGAVAQALIDLRYKQAEDKINKII
ncbi:MAG: HNH endonuclease [Bacteroidota bacterium]